MLRSGPYSTTRKSLEEVGQRGWFGKPELLSAPESVTEASEYFALKHAIDMGCKCCRSVVKGPDRLIVVVGTSAISAYCHCLVAIFGRYLISPST